MPKILLVDDNYENLRHLQDNLEQWLNAEVDTFKSPKVALEQAAKAVYDIVIANFKMEEMDGINFLEEYRSIHPHVSRLLISKHNNSYIFYGAITNTHITRSVEQPFSEETMRTIVEEILSDKGKPPIAFITSEKRKHTRIALRFPTTISFDDGLILNATTRDISFAGTFLETVERLPSVLPTTCTLQILLDQTDINGAAITIRSELKRLEQFGLSMLFLSTDNESYCHLKKLLLLNALDPQKLEQELKANPSVYSTYKDNN